MIDQNVILWELEQVKTAEALEERFQKYLGKKWLLPAEFKEWWYVGKVGDLAMFLRIQLCNAKQTPDLFSLMCVMWKDRVIKRLSEYLD